MIDVARSREFDLELRGVLSAGSVVVARISGMQLANELRLESVDLLESWSVDPRDHRPWIVFWGQVTLLPHVVDRCLHVGLVVFCRRDLVECAWNHLE